MIGFTRYSVPVFGITGWKNSGKTLLTTRLIEFFARKNLRVGAIKHAHHSFEIDHEGRDSFRMRQAGARQIAIVSKYRWAMISELQPEPEPDLEALLAHFASFDLVLAEGYKQLSFPKIEARSRYQKTRQMLARERKDIVAIASDIASDKENNDAGLPVFPPGDIDAIGGFIGRTLNLARW